MDSQADIDAILNECAAQFFQDTDRSSRMSRYIRRFAIDSTVAREDELSLPRLGGASEAHATSPQLAHHRADICCGIHPLAANCTDTEHLHRHTFFELVYVFRGACMQYAPAGTTQLKAGSFCLLNRSARHGIAIASEDDIVFNILISSSCFTRILRNLIPQESMLSEFFWESIFETDDTKRDFIVFDPNPGSRAEQFIKSLLVEYIEPQPGYNQAMAAYLSLLFCELMRSHIYRIESSMGNTVPYMDLIDYIDRHLADVTLSSLAEAFHYSERYLSRAIKQLTNHTFSELLTSMRLNCSADYLEHTDMSIDAIAEQLGFYDHSHYNRVFKKRFGVTPSAWRAEHRER